MRNRDSIILFLLDTFVNGKQAQTMESLLMRLADDLESQQLELEEEPEIYDSESLDNKAKRYLQAWTQKGFLTNYQDEKGDIYYELTAHTSKTIDWLISLKKEEYIGTESKFKNIYNQLKELVEFSNENKDERIRILEEQKQELERKIHNLNSGEEVKVFEEHEMVPRFNQLTQSAKELLSDFKEVEDNFKNLTKSIYLTYTEGGLTKGDILGIALDGWQELKGSPQGKSFYAFWEFLRSSNMQREWDDLTHELYDVMEEKGIRVEDLFLKKMSDRLYSSGKKVIEANNKMAEKLNAIMREKEASKSENIRRVIHDVKNLLLESTKEQSKPDISLILEDGTDISLPFDRPLTMEPNEQEGEVSIPPMEKITMEASEQLAAFFKQIFVDRKLLRQNIQKVLEAKSQTSLEEVIEQSGGIQKGLSEVFAYIAVASEFHHHTLDDSFKTILFSKEKQKSIRIPEMIITR